MTTDTTADDDSNSLLNELDFSRLLAVSMAISLVLTAAVGVAAAQSGEDKSIDSDDSLFCNKDGGNWLYETGGSPAHTHLGSAIETLIQLMFALGIVGVFIVWQGSAIGSIVTMDRSQKRKLKRYRGSAVRSFAVLLLIGPIFTIMQGAMNLQSAGCINLSPF